MRGRRGRLRVGRDLAAVRSTSGGAAPTRRVLVSCHDRGPSRFRGVFVPTFEMALNSDGEQKSNLVLRVDQDSDSVLQSLFDTVLKPDSKRPLQVPLRMRQLPKSFFNPPSTGSKSPSVSHSRENSADSAFGSSAGGGSGGGSGSSVVSVSHSRAHSSPASLQQTYTAGAQQGQQPPLLPQHVKQRSYDVGPHLHDDLGPLPPGWEQARTPEGQIYYLKYTNIGDDYSYVQSALPRYAWTATGVLGELPPKGARASQYNKKNVFKVLNKILATVGSSKIKTYKTVMGTAVTGGGYRSPPARPPIVQWTEPKREM
ncbi:Transcriptional coactivator yorkie [Eumeta japonica]|uniref:Transcriptional coactivator yorkie n=1 Tax=Eumeta variegata TaxID=151549 RepID=A0A4C1UQ67_EUMVA|nr:Transcriptional coactivator yorkie [Eumeta japonica]